MANTYTKISTTPISGVNTVLLSAIPATFDDLVLKFSLNSSYTGGGACNLQIQFNGSSSGYQSKVFYAYGSASSNFTTETWTTLTQYGYTAGRMGYMINSSTSGSVNLFSSAELYIGNYCNSTGFAKTWLGAMHTAQLDTNNGGSNSSGTSVGRWNSGEAITSIRLVQEDLGSATFNSGSNVTLYGIKRT
jgi:hypothetical protein